MSNDINLLYSRQKGTLGVLTRKVKLLRFIAIGALTSAAVLTVGVLLLIFASPLPKLKQQENALLDTLSRQHEKITKQTLLVNRLNDISQIIAKRPKTREFLITFTKDVPKNVEITSLDAEAKAIRISLETIDLPSLDAYIGSLKRASQQDKRIGGIVMNSLSLSDGVYRADFSIELL